MYKIMSNRLLQSSYRKRRLELKSSHVIMQEIPRYGGCHALQYIVLTMTCCQVFHFHCFHRRKIKPVGLSQMKQN